MRKFNRQGLPMMRLENIRIWKMLKMVSNGCYRP
jgi:hypothetical protein